MMAPLYGDFKTGYDPKILLGRDELIFNQAILGDQIDGRSILITGAAGSIGSELTRQICRYAPEMLTLVDNCEYGLVRLQQKLKGIDGFKIKILLGDITDQAEMESIFATAKPEIVYHTAALKHVPFVENQPFAAVKVNIFGTKILADISAKSEVEKFIFISSDKAVNPASLMGATKRFGELIMGCLQSTGKTEFITTRFGNVVGSSGSVAQIFQEQIDERKPIMITHIDMKRYLMTAFEAGQLLLTAAGIGRHGEILISEMGNPVHIVDLAQKMIRLNGLIPYTDIDIQFTGIRQGEKLHEDLHSPTDVIFNQPGTGILTARLAATSVIDLKKCMAALMDSHERRDHEGIISHLKLAIPEYNVSPAELDLLRNHL